MRNNREKCTLSKLKTQYISLLKMKQENGPKRLVIAMTNNENLLKFNLKQKALILEKIQTTRKTHQLRKRLRAWRLQNWKNFSKKPESLLAVRNRISLIASTSEPLPGIEPSPLLIQCAPYTKGVPIGLPPYSHRTFVFTRQSAYPHSLGQWQLCARQFLSRRNSPRPIVW